MHTYVWVHNITITKVKDGSLGRKLLEVNQNESDIWFKYIEWTFVRKSEEMNIITEGIRLCLWRRNMSFVCLCWLENMRNKSYSIVMLLFGLVTNVRLLLILWLFNIVKSIDPLLFKIWYYLLQLHLNIFCLFMAQISFSFLFQTYKSFTLISIKWLKRILSWSIVEFWNDFGVYNFFFFQDTSIFRTS